MHSVYIGISGDDHLVVSEVVYVFFNVQGRLQEVELLIVVVVDDLL